MQYSKIFCPREYILSRETLSVSIKMTCHIQADKWLMTKHERFCHFLGTRKNLGKVYFLISITWQPMVAVFYYYDEFSLNKVTRKVTNLTSSCPIGASVFCYSPVVSRWTSQNDVKFFLNWYYLLWYSL